MTRAMTMVVARAMTVIKEMTTALTKAIIIQWKWQ